MPKFIYIIFVVISATAVAVGDVLLKKASNYTNFYIFLKSPWVIIAILLYILSTLIFSYLFFIGTKLVDVGIVQIILYAIIVVGSGVLFFNETLSLVKIIGILLGITGVILINL